MITSNQNKDKVFIVIGIIVIIILSYFLFFKDMFKSRVQILEEELISSAKNYVERNNIITNKEIYIDSSKLDITLDEGCSILSGVIYDGNDYKPYLMCRSYHTKLIDNSSLSEYISLRGDDVVILAKGMTFYDPGYVSNDSVVETGDLGTEEGVYTIHYKTRNSDHLATRKVIIIDNSSLKSMYPTITLNGDEIIYLVKNTIYKEAGVIARDTIDGDITNNVIIGNNINNNVIGEYKVNYIVTNSRGFTYSLNRKIQVVEKDSDLVLNYSLSTTYLTNESVTIKLNIKNEYEKIIYPDGSSGNNLEYVVTSNGKYLFKVYDKYGREKELEVIINNIDKSMPNGVCIANVFYGRTEVVLNTSSFKNVNSYDYIIDNTSTGFIQSQKYISKISNPKEVRVILKDNVNNKQELLCEIVDKTKRVVVTNEKGKNCLDGYTCYVQFDYGNVSKYPYCSTSNNPKSCGGIGRSGCSITSVSIASTYEFFDIHSRSGATYTPFTIWEEAYPINKKTGQCNGGCSGWARMREALIATGLSVTKEQHINRQNMPELIEHLKKGYPAIVHAQNGAYTDVGHYMVLIGYQWEDGKVFLSNPDGRGKTKKREYKGKMYYQDTWISPNDLITGQVDEYVLVGPKGMF